MELKNGGIALPAASLILLALALMTGGIVFYASLAAVAATVLADAYRFITLRSDLRRRLEITRALSKTEMLPGSGLTVTYRFTYRGRRTVPLQCVQAAGPDLLPAGPAARLDLRPGTNTLEYALTASGRGRQTVPGLLVSFETFLFRGSLAAGGGDEINVYPALDSRPGRISRGSLAGSVTDDEAVRQDSGSDFSHIRAYAPGDSTRNIDWARSSRHGSLVVKAFEDVRSRPVFILIDVDPSMEAGAKKTGLGSAVELATHLSARVLRENERVGIACFSSSDVTAYLPMASGPRQMTQIRQLLASVRAVRGDREPRGNMALPHEAIAAGQAFGHDGLSAVVDEAVREFTANVKEDGLVRAIFRASRSAGVPCHIIVATGLSMGMASLLDGARIARYYGHNVTVALAPRVWYEPGDGVDAEQCYRLYRETMDSIACLRSHKIGVIELSPSGRPEDTMMAGRPRRPVRAVR